MAEKIIPLVRPVDFGTGSKIESLTLRGMDAGDYFDGAAAIRENASKAELEANIAAICAGVSFAVIRALHPSDLLKLSNWYEAQWKVPEGESGDEDPSKADAGKPSSSA